MLIYGLVLLSAVVSSKLSLNFSLQLIPIVMYLLKKANDWAELNFSFVHGTKIHSTLESIMFLPPLKYSPVLSLTQKFLRFFSLPI